MKILKRPSISFVETTWLFYRRVDTPTAGLAFDLDSTDKPILRTEESERSYARAVAGVGTEYLPPVRRTHTNKVRDYGTGVCACGSHVSFGWGDSTCVSCGAEYNSAGQRLAPRHQWGEETGEHPCEVVQ